MILERRQDMPAKKEMEISAKIIWAVVSWLVLVVLAFYFMLLGFLMVEVNSKDISPEESDRIIRHFFEDNTEEIQITAYYEAYEIFDFMHVPPANISFTVSKTYYEQIYLPNKNNLRYFWSLDVLSRTENTVILTVYRRGGQAKLGQKGIRKYYNLVIAIPSKESVFPEAHMSAFLYFFIGGIPYLCLPLYEIIRCCIIRRRKTRERIEGIINAAPKMREQ